MMEGIFICPTPSSFSYFCTCIVFCISKFCFVFVHFILLTVLVGNLWTAVTSGNQIRNSSPAAVFTNKFKSLVN